MKIIVAPDSFKECMTADEAAGAIAAGVLDVLPDAEVMTIPLSDGGEGLTRTVAKYIDTERKVVKVTGPIGMPVEAQYLLDEANSTAYVEMASAAGLTLVPEPYRDPMMTTTRGVGEMIMDAVNRGAVEIMLGLGGSATNDAGLGALQALGLRCLDMSGKEINLNMCGGLLSVLTDLDTTELRMRLKGVRVQLVCDVDAPFVGPHGAVAVFSAQKGADSEGMMLLEKGMVNVAEVIRRKTGKDISDIPGAGAAGGMGGPFMALLGAKQMRGIDFVLDTVRFDEALEGASLVITGEGRSDRQTLMWKVPYGVLHRSAQHGVPVALVSGAVNDIDMLAGTGFDSLTCINESESTAVDPLDKSIAGDRLRRHTSLMVRDWLQRLTR